MSKFVIGLFTGIIVGTLIQTKVDVYLTSSEETDVPYDEEDISDVYTDWD